MGAVTRWFCLTKASASVGTRRIVLAVSMLMLGMLALAARADAYLYWAATPLFGLTPPGAIGRADPDGTNVNQSLCCSNPLGLNPYGVAVDDTYLYWTFDLPNGTIARADKLDGGDSTPDFIATGARSNNVAVNSQHIYWSTEDTAAIGRASINGGQVQPNFIPGPLGFLTGLAVDGRHIYWSNDPSNGPPVIGRANLDGTQVNPDLVTGDAPSDSFDDVFVHGNRLYWTSQNRGTIGTATINGKLVNQDFISGLSTPNAVAVDAVHIYWSSDPQSSTIGSANLDGSNVQQNLIGLPSEFQVNEMAVDALPATCAGTDATIAGTGGSDKLRGTDDDDVIAARGGDDTVVGLRGDDLVCGGRGDDKLRGQGGDDTLSGGRGKDELRGGGGSNKCRGGSGSDSKHRC